MSWVWTNLYTTRADRKSTRLNSSHITISYAVFCLKKKKSLIHKKLFRIRMSRNFRMKMLAMTKMPTECLILLTKMVYNSTTVNQIVKQNSNREMRLRMVEVTVAYLLAAQPVTTNLRKFMRASIKLSGVSNLQSFIASMTHFLFHSDVAHGYLHSFPTRRSSD